MIFELVYNLDEHPELHRYVSPPTPVAYYVYGCKFVEGKAGWRLLCRYSRIAWDDAPWADGAFLVDSIVRIDPLPPEPVLERPKGLADPVANAPAAARYFHDPGRASRLRRRLGLD